MCDLQNEEVDYPSIIRLIIVNGLNPGVSVVCLVRDSEDDYRSGCQNVSHRH